MANKDIACSFLLKIANGKIEEAFEKFVDSEMIHHNLYFPGDAESLKSAMLGDARANPEKILVVKQVIEEQGLVVTHSHVKQNSEHPGFVMVHIFRMQEGKIVELWDIGQPIPENSPNLHGAF